MSKMLTKFKPVANPEIVLREEFDNLFRLFNPDSDETFGINSVGAIIWRRLDGTRTIKDIIGEVNSRCETLPEEAEEDVIAFIRELKEKEMLITSSVANPQPGLVRSDRKTMANEFMKTPRSLDIAITNRCNLRCKYCSHFSSAGDVGRDLPIEEWLRFFEELNRCAVMNVCLQGGEPFYREDLPDIIEGIVRNRMRFSILSNGTLISEDIAAFLGSTGRCDGVQVSIDGSISITHDAFRGAGSFSKAIQGIRNLQKHDAPVSVRVTIHRNNVRDLDSIAELLIEEIGLAGFSTNSASHMGLCRQNAEQVQMTTEERSLAMDTLKRLNEKYDGHISATAGPLAEARSWMKIKDARETEGEDFPQGGYLTGCGCPFESIAVRADGFLVPCIQMSHIELGRINKDDLQDIWLNHSELRRLRERKSVPLSEFEFCQGCDYINFCTGNCPALAYLMLGTDHHPSPDACLKRFLEAGGKLPNLNS